jgi:hypothetical protein
MAHMLALFGNVVLWASYAFAMLCLVHLVYAVSQGGAREVATWVVMISLCTAALVIGSLIRYILGGKRKA